MRFIWLLIFFNYFIAQNSAAEIFCGEALTQVQVNHEQINLIATELAKMRLSFLIDHNFYQDSLYRQSSLDKFRSEYQNLLALGGPLAEKLYLEKLQELAPQNLEFERLRIKRENKISKDFEEWQGQGMKLKLRDEQQLQGKVVKVLKSASEDEILIEEDFHQVYSMNLKTGKTNLKYYNHELVESDSINKYVLTNYKKGWGIFETIRIDLRDAVTQQTYYTFKESGSLMGTTITPDNKFALAGRSNGKLYFIDLQNPSREESLFIERDAWLNLIAVGLNLKIVSVRNGWQKFYIIDYLKRQVMHQIVHPHKITDLKVSADSQWTIITDESDKLSIYDNQTGLLVKDYQLTNRIKSVRLNADSRFIFFNLSSGELRGINLETDNMFSLLADGAGHYFSFSSDFKNVFLLNHSGTLRVYETGL